MPELHAVPPPEPTPTEGQRALSRLSDHPIGRRNVVWGWMAMWIGILSGSILMAWSFGGPFPAPPGFEDYGSLPRRMTRLAHIAQVMLPLINIVIGRELDRVYLSDRWKQICSWCAIVGMVGVPTGLLLASVVHVSLKYVAVVPVNCFLFALVLMGIGTLRASRRE